MPGKALSPTYVAANAMTLAHQQRDSRTKIKLNDVIQFFPLGVLDRKNPNPKSGKVLFPNRPLHEAGFLNPVEFQERVSAPLQCSLDTKGGNLHGTFATLGTALTYIISLLTICKIVLWLRIPTCMHKLKSAMRGAIHLGGGELGRDRHHGVPYTNQIANLSPFWSALHDMTYREFANIWRSRLHL